MEITIKYDNTQEAIFFVPVVDKLTDMIVTDSRGRKLPQLKDVELEKKFHICKEDLFDKSEIPHDDIFERIPVLVSPSDSEFETLTITFVLPINPKRYSSYGISPSMRIKFGFRITPNEFAIKSDKYIITGDSYDLRIQFETGDDYRIGDSHIKIDNTNGKATTTSSKRIPNTVFFHVSNMHFADNVIGHVIITIARSTSSAAMMISLAGLTIPLFLMAGQLYSKTLFLPTLELLVGVIAVLIGSRIWVIKDKYIMRRWVGIHYGILAVNATVFVVWFVALMSGIFKTI